MKAKGNNAALGGGNREEL